VHGGPVHGSFSHHLVVVAARRLDVEVRAAPRRDLQNQHALVELRQ
jgi:hypothetical protein